MTLDERVLFALFERGPEHAFEAFAFPMAAKLNAPLADVARALESLDGHGNVEGTGYSWRLTPHGVAWVQRELLKANARQKECT